MYALAVGLLFIETGIFPPRPQIIFGHSTLVKLVSLFAEVWVPRAIIRVADLGVRIDDGPYSGQTI